MTNSYVRYASPINVQKMLPVNPHEILRLTTINPTEEHFLSVYRYSEAQYKEYKKSRSASGMTGMLTNMLVFDFDSKTDIELARADAKEMFTRLLHAGLTEDSIQLYSSGYKGFHVVVTLNQFLDKKQILNVIRNLSKDLKTLDLQIYDEARLFRCPLSYHAKSGLYKIPLSKDALFELPLDQIKLMAKEQDIHVDQLNSWNYEVVLPKQLLEYKEIEEAQDEDFADTILSSESPDFSRKPKHITDAKFALQEGYFEPGERNHAYMVLAALYRHLGYSKEIAYNMLKATDRLHVKRCKLKNIKRETKAKEEIWKQIINPTYSLTWNGGTFSEQNDELLLKTKERYHLKKETNQDLIDTSFLSTSFKKFATEIDQNTIKLGFDKIDQEIQITTSMLVYLLAAPSAGKSSITFSILNHASKNNLNTLFFSLDMGSPLVYQRLLQKHTGLSSKTIFNTYKENDIVQIEKYNNLVQSEYKNIKFCFKSGLTVEDIETYMEDDKKITGTYPKLIALDYLECITGPYSDQTANGAFIANKLKDIANKYECTVLLLVQPQKSAGDPSAELNSMRCVKGASVLEQAASIIFTLSRPGFDPKNPDNDRFATITVVKNRMGQLNSWDFAWNGITGQIGHLTEEKKRDLDELRSRKAKEKMEQNNF